MKNDSRHSQTPVGAMLHHLEGLLARSDALTAEHAALLEEAEELLLAIEAALTLRAVQH